MPVVTYRQALNEALREEMNRDEDVFCLGEEIGHFVLDHATAPGKGIDRPFERGEESDDRERIEQPRGEEWRAFGEANRGASKHRKLRLQHVDDFGDDLF